MSKPIPRQRFVPPERPHSVVLRRIAADAPGSFISKVNLATDLIAAVDRGVGSKAALRVFGDSVREQIRGIGILRPSLRETLSENSELANAVGCLMELLA
jgi:hypothetical protein